MAENNTPSKNEVGYLGYLRYLRNKNDGELKDQFVRDRRKDAVELSEALKDYYGLRTLGQIFDKLVFEHTDELLKNCPEEPPNSKPTNIVIINPKRTQEMEVGTKIEVDDHKRTLKQALTAVKSYINDIETALNAKKNFLPLSSVQVRPSQFIDSVRAKRLKDIKRANRFLRQTKLQDAELLSLLKELDVALSVLSEKQQQFYGGV
jgi:hypothetical protein